MWEFSRERKQIGYVYEYEETFFKEFAQMIKEAGKSIIWG